MEIVRVKIFMLALVLSLVAPSFAKDDASGNIPEDVKKEIKRLSARNGNVKRDAVRNLGEMREKAAPSVTELIKLLSDETRIGRYNLKGSAKSYTVTFLAEEAAKALGNIGAPSVMPLIAKLEDENASVRKYAVYALGLTKDKRAVAPLIDALKSDDPTLLKYTFFSLKNITGEDIPEKKDVWREWFKAR